MNVLCMSGRLARDNQAKTINVKSGTDTMMVLENALAFTHWNPSKKEEETHYLKIKLKGKQAEFVNNHFGKGDGIILNGSILTESWEKDGQKHYGCFMAVEKAEFGQKKKEDGKSQSTPNVAASNGGNAQTPQNTSGYVEENVEDDDLPF